MINSTIGKLNDKTATHQTFKIDNTNISDPSLITYNFCDFITNIGVKYANSIPPSVKGEYNYLTILFLALLI